MARKIIMITDLQSTRNEVKDLLPISETQYENIFKLGKADKYFFYNIIKKVSFPEDLGTEVYTERHITSETPWTAFSHNIYGTQDLWWLICCVNNIQNPTINPTIGKLYKLIKPQLISGVLAEINKQIK